MTSVERGVTPPVLLEIYQRHRRYLLGVAYRILGTVTEAEDALQETWVRAQSADLSEVEDPERWLTTVTSRICLDVLKSARVQRERYVGEWLPEPIVDHVATAPDPADRVTLAESVDLALLVVLESLSPAERTAFVLHDVFKVPFETIADAVGRTPAACRQLAARARAHVETSAPRFVPDPDQHQRAVEAFARATSEGDLGGLVAVLDPDVVLRSDGGGVVPARRTPLVSARAVAELLLWIMEHRPGTELHLTTVNANLGIVSSIDGEVTGVIGCTVVDGRIAELDMVMNPDKLTRVTIPPHD